MNVERQAVQGRLLIGVKGPDDKKRRERQIVLLLSLKGKEFSFLI